MFVYKYLGNLLEGGSNSAAVLLSENINSLRELSSSPKGQSKANNKMEQLV